ncbi:MAG TPA: dCMP deaminase family protein, partial [Tepidisphaeraceae bacterium]|nr:dCMP deaminase family protein [Tepidisphaeraceae bacterium]
MKKTAQGPKSAKQSRRVSEDQYYLNIAREVAARSTCLRRKFGAVIVQNKQIISTGYCGAPRGTANCSDIGECLRNQLGAKKGEHYEWCRSVHGEANAIIHASRLDMIGSTLYLVGLETMTNEVVADAEPCRMCKRMIINAGIECVVIQLGQEKIRRIKVADSLTPPQSNFIGAPNDFGPDGCAGCAGCATGPFSAGAGV